MTSPAELANQVREALDHWAAYSEMNEDDMRKVSEGRAALSVLEERLEQTEKALREVCDVAEVAHDHIVNELQPEFARLADDKPLHGKLDQRTAASRLATWYHGVWDNRSCEEVIALARGVVGEETTGG